MSASSYINGNWVVSEGASQISNIDPSTMQVVSNINAATNVEAELAVQSAKQAFETWGQTSGADRAVYLTKIADILERDKERLIALSSKVNGKPLEEADFDVSDAVATFQYYANAAIELDKKQEANVPLSMGGFTSYVRHEPAGVAALITPWNFPLVTSAWKMAPALAAGCTVILKPAEAVSSIELEWGRIADDAGVPAGVLNIVAGKGSEVGPLLTTHPDVDKVSFTGGNNVGAGIAASAAPSFKSVSLELGGKSPIVVFQDADLDKAVEAVMAGIFFNCGQMCSATSRLIVHDSLSDKLLARLIEATKALKVGAGSDPETQMGPMTTVAQYNTVIKYFEVAKREGLDCITGGSAIERDGLFLKPTIYKNVPFSSALWKEEIFGPVLCTQTFSTEEQALELAHDTNYGLAATLCSANKDTLRRFSRKLRAGHIWWNMPQIVPVETSWGGFGYSGTGRELGPWGMSAYLEVKHVDFEA